MQKSSMQKCCSLLKTKIPQNRAPNERNVKGNLVTIIFFQAEAKKPI